jgi:hypothetical protein
MRWLHSLNGVLPKETPVTPDEADVLDGGDVVEGVAANGLKLLDNY